MLDLQRLKAYEAIFLPEMTKDRKAIIRQVDGRSDVFQGKRTKKDSTR
jgi:hypothetical protein